MTQLLGIDARVDALCILLTFTVVLAMLLWRIVRWLSVRDLRRANDQHTTSASAESSLTNERAAPGRSPASDAPANVLDALFNDAANADDETPAPMRAIERLPHDMPFFIDASGEERPLRDPHPVQVTLQASRVLPSMNPETDIKAGELLVGTDGELVAVSSEPLPGWRITGDSTLRTAVAPFWLKAGVYTLDYELPVSAQCFLVASQYTTRLLILMDIAGSGRLYVRVPVADDYQMYITFRVQRETVLWSVELAPYSGTAGGAES